MPIVDIGRKDGVRTAVISSGQTTSAVVDISGYSSVLMALPAAMTGTTISFQVSDTRAGTFQSLYDSSNTLISISITASRTIALPFEVGMANFIKLVSGSSEGADRTITLICKG